MTNVENDLFFRFLLLFSLSERVFSSSFYRVHLFYRLCDSFYLLHVSVTFRWSSILCYSSAILLNCKFIRKRMEKSLFLLLNIYVFCFAFRFCRCCLSLFALVFPFGTTQSHFSTKTVKPTLLCKRSACFRIPSYLFISVYMHKCNRQFFCS